MNIKMLQKNGWIIGKFLVGSHAYGTFTETSDHDYRGLFMVPMSNRVSLYQKWTEIGQEKPDEKYYELGKYFELATECNPNIIEYLFMPADCVLYCNPVMQRVIDNRHLFISKRAYHTFSGYAYAQIKKAKGENKWINNPKSETPPQRDDFCWVIPIDRIMPAMDNWRGLGVMPCRPIPIQEYARMRGDFTLQPFHAAALEHVPDTYRLYYYGENAKGVFRDGNLACESISKEDEYTKFWGLLIYNDQEYQKAMLDWKNYWTWVRERNPHRWVSQESGEVDYDCYVDSETEFLTDAGWKKFDKVSDKDLLATVTDERTLIYQKPNDKIDKIYSGEIFSFENRYTRFSITPNHKLRISFCHRNSRNGFSVGYKKERANWQLMSAQEYMNGKNSFANIVASVEKEDSDTEYPISDDWIRLAGAYLSEGSIIFNKNGTCQGISIAQNGGKPLCDVMEGMREFQVALTVHTGRGKNGKRREHNYRIQDRIVAEQFLNMMGHGSQNKKLPEIIFSFSYRQVMLLLEIMMMGDGHKHGKGHSIYYSVSYELISDLQRLLFINGMATQIYGPYIYNYLPKWNRRPSYQLFIPKNAILFTTINKRSPRSKKSQCGWMRHMVEGCRVVCFDMPSGVVITRNKNKISVQGNCKNMQHCFRLLISGEAILKTGAPIVRFEGEQLQYLRDIRAGKFSHEVLMAEVDRRMESLKVVVEESKLPWGPDKEAIDELYWDIVSK